MKMTENIKPDANTWYDKGRELFHLGKYDEAIKAINEAIKIDSKFADAWNGKGWVLFHQGKYDEAINCYSEALHLDPTHFKAWGNKGSVLGETAAAHSRSKLRSIRGAAA